MKTSDRFFGVFGVALTAFFVLALVALLACTKQQAQSVDTLALDLTGAICAVAEDQPVGQPGVDIVCTVAQAIESGTGNVIQLLPSPNAGTTTVPTIAVKTIRFRNLSKPVAQAILAMHGGGMLPADAGAK